MFILVKDHAQTLPSSDVQVGDLVQFGDRWRQRLHLAGVGDALMRPMLVAEGIGQNRVEQVGRLAVAIADQEPRPFE